MAFDLKNALDLLSAGNTAELRLALLEARTDQLEKQNRIEELEREKRALEEALKLSTDFVRREGALWLDGEKDPGPYCTACWDLRRVAVRISVNIAGAMCPGCQQSYGISAETRTKHDFPQVGNHAPAFFGESMFDRNRQF